MCRWNWWNLSLFDPSWSIIPSYPVITTPLLSRPRAPYCIDTTWSASTATWSNLAQLGPNPANSEGDVKVRPVIYPFLPVINWSFSITWCGLVLCLCGFLQLVPSERWHCWFQSRSWPSCALVLSSTRQNSMISSDIKWYQVIQAGKSWRARESMRIGGIWRFCTLR